MSHPAKGTALAIAVFTTLSLGLNYVSALQSLPDQTPVEVAWRLLGFFTNLTNALVAICFALMVWRGRYLTASWLGGLTVWAAIVGIVYYGLLRQDYEGLGYVSDICVHGLVPAAVAAWWLAWAPKRLGWVEAVIWLTWPLVYVVYAFLRGAIAGVYPYFFIDPLAIGWMGVAVWSAALCVAFLIGGVLVVTVGRYLEGRRASAAVSQAGA